MERDDSNQAIGSWPKLDEQQILALVVVRRANIGARSGDGGDGGDDQDGESYR